MFVDFDKVFNSKPQTQMKVPEALVQYLSEQLPTGLKYVAAEDGSCRIASVEGRPITIGGFLYEPTEQQRQVLGEKYTVQDVLDYSYNAQQQIGLSLKRDGYILLNGEEFPVEKLQYHPYNPLTFVSGSVYMQPTTFPGPFSLTIGNGKYERTLRIRRVPNESISVAAFESEKESVLHTSYYVDEKRHHMTMSISFNLTYAHTVRDMVEATSIYNSFLDGKGFMGGKPFESKLVGADVHKFDQSSLEFWEKVLCVEDCLSVSFTPPHRDVEFDEMCIVEQLYQNLIQTKPIRDMKRIDSIDGAWDLTSEKDIRESIGQPLFFEFTALRSIELFGVELELPCLLRIFNAILAGLSEDGNTKKIILEDQSCDKPRYTSFLCFKDEEHMKKYEESVDRNISISQFHDAKRAGEYLIVQEE